MEIASIMRSVVSSNIDKIGYDDMTRTLIVLFKGKSGTYVYDDVPPEIDEELRAIEAEGASIGKFFQASIRNHFPSHRLPANATADA